MKAIIIGLGSMGRRRAQLLRKIDKTVQIVGIDMLDERRFLAESELGLKTALSVNEACEKYHPDMAFVSTSPLSHASIIKECLNSNLHVFTELNLVDTDYDKNMYLAAEKKRILFLSSTFLYRKEIQYIKAAVSRCESRLSYMYHTGQYLPDWHPWEKYKDFFISKRETNGCREIMAIEFPWLIDIFGDIRKVYSVKGKNSSLDIDFPDCYWIIFEHVSGHKGMIAVDIISRKAVRNFELSGENLYLSWNGTPNGLRRYDLEKKQALPVYLYKSFERRQDYSTSIIEDAYMDEISNFINVIKGTDDPRYSFEKDKKVLSIINEIEGRK